MLDAAFQFVEKIITDFSWKRILIYLFFVASVMGAIVGYETYTRNFELTRLEKTTNLLKSIESLSNSEVKEVKELTSKIILRLNSITSKQESSDKDTYSPSLIQAIAGASPWLLFLLIYAPIAVRRKEKDWEYGVLGLTIISTIVAVLAYVIPPSYSGWIRYGAVQLANVLVLAIFSYIGNKDDE